MRNRRRDERSVENLPRPAAAVVAASLWPHPEDQFFLPTLARRAVETFLLERRTLTSAEAPTCPALEEAAACFVCLKTIERRLRGCIGTIQPTEKTLTEEIICNAVSAATRDPRFRPVTTDELPLLRFMVDVLERPEPARLEDLDPSEYGVIVEDNTGRRRGLLLPAIDGVETAREQIEIAARKAGLLPGEPHTLYRFRVRRFREAA